MSATLDIPETAIAAGDFGSLVAALSATGLVGALSAPNGTNAIRIKALVTFKHTYIAAGVLHVYHIRTNSLPAFEHPFDPLYNTVKC